MLETKQIKLTQYSSGSGCGCKIAPADLEKILVNEKNQKDFNELLVGNATRDDAAVYELDNERCLISTTDFFTPIVDDAFTFGKIAAANAISDVYAMGGKPIMALAILGWPIDKLPVELIAEVMRGAREICEQANIPLAGGHSIKITEPVFGLSVNGIIKKENIKKNIGAKAGDLIYITKKIGVGILATAEKRGVLKPEHENIGANQMIILNTIGETLGTKKYINAMTDITGFGLLGHLAEMCADTLSAEVEYSKVPIIDAAREYAKAFVFADNTTRNWNAIQDNVEGINGESMLTLCDPQTNGGLMVAVNPANKTEFEELLAQFQLTEFAKPIGTFKSKTQKTIVLV